MTRQMLGKITVISLFSAAVVLSSGCASSRVDDLRDCGKFSLGVGRGLGVHVGLGALTHPAIGIGSWTTRVGYESRENYGKWDESEFFFPIANARSLVLGVASGGHGYVPHPLNVSYLRMSSKRTSRQRPATAPRLANKEGYWVNFLPRDRFASPAPPKSPIDFEAGGTLLFVSARVGLNPVEILDYLLGFTGVDIMEDDYTDMDEETIKNIHEIARLVEEYHKKTGHYPIGPISWNDSDNSKRDDFVKELKAVLGDDIELPKAKPLPKDFRRTPLLPYGPPGLHRYSSSGGGYLVEGSLHAKTEDIKKMVWRSHHYAIASQDMPRMGRYEYKKMINGEYCFDIITPGTGRMEGPCGKRHPYPMAHLNSAEKP